AAVRALEATVAAGHVDEATAEQVNGEAFAAAQLDGDDTALFDSFGSEGDPTVAVSNMEAALLSMRTMMDKIEAGEMTVAPRPLDAPMTTPGSSGTGHGADGTSSSGGTGGPGPSGGQNLDGSGGFLWKPESEADGNLVVLLPTDLKGLIDRVEIHSQLPPDDVTKLAEGRFSGDTHNGGRPHFRFDKPGGEFGSDVHVVVFKDDGTTATWQIGNGSERHD
ncbi:MAG: hypothetical protein KDD69_18465, partial [Bdellovibrionales bacterium]|nr:hypothetical protein [Bdellovibrionales bacterium]